MDKRRSAGETRDSRFTQVIELMRDSVITQALVTIMALAATLWMAIDGRTVPGELWAIDGLTLGFYFGGKVQSGAARLVDRHVSRIADAAEAKRDGRERPE
jgi:hypothetical protein